jgi:hypothetical protein
MNIAATKQRYTPEDLLAMPDGKDYELVNGIKVASANSLVKD